MSRLLPSWSGRRLCDGRLGERSADGDGSVDREGARKTALRAGELLRVALACVAEGTEQDLLVGPPGLLRGVAGQEVGDEVPEPGMLRAVELGWAGV